MLAPFQRLKNTFPPVNTLHLRHIIDWLMLQLPDSSGYDILRHSECEAARHPQI